MSKGRVLSLFVVLVYVGVGIVCPRCGFAQELEVTMRTQKLGHNEYGEDVWRPEFETKKIVPEKTAIVIIDVWDKHHSKGSERRGAVIAKNINTLITQARDRGMTIIHAPGYVMDFYEDSPARKRIVNAPRMTLKSRDGSGLAIPPVGLPPGTDSSDIDDHTNHRPWTRQHPAIVIDHDRDAIAYEAVLLENYLTYKGIEHVIVVGLHVNICVVQGQHGIRGFQSSGFSVTLCRDLTDALVTPREPPYLNQAEATRVAVEYVEKFICPTIESADVCD